MSDKREICMQEYEKVVLCESEIRYASKVALHVSWKLSKYVVIVKGLQFTATAG